MSFVSKRIFSLLLLIPLVLHAVSGQANGALRFAPLPMEGRKILHEQFFGLTRYLQEVTGRAVELVDFEDYGALLDAFRNNLVDLAYLGPLPYALLAKSDDGVEPLACFREPDGESRYTCSLVGAGDNPVDPAKSRELHIGLTQPYSTCGYLAVSLMLETVGRSLEDPGIRFTYVGSHTEAALGVVRGEFDLAGVKTAVAKRYRHLDLRRLMVSRPFPGFGLYANRRSLASEDIARLRQALLRLDPLRVDGDRERLMHWGGSVRNGLVAPSHCDDQGLLDAVDRLPPQLEASP